MIESKPIAQWKNEGIAALLKEGTIAVLIDRFPNYSVGQSIWMCFLNFANQFQDLGMEEYEPKGFEPPQPSRALRYNYILIDFEIKIFIKL